MYNPVKPYKKQTIDLIRQTWNTPFVEVKDGIYPIIEKKFSGLEVDHTDGIGTKGFYHWRERTFKNAVLDALAMNLNDLALARAVPYKLQNHITVPKEDSGIIEIIEALSAECQKRKIAITGGETSVHNNFDCLDIGITISGFIENFKPNKFIIGDRLIGIKSNGLHSNGFTKVREVFGEEQRAEFVEPTAIYLDKILELDKKYDLHGLMHITGGAYTKLKDLLVEADVKISRNHKLRPQQIFEDLHSKGVLEEDMYKIFNCGIGFIFSVTEEKAKEIISENENMDIIGEIVSGSGKVIVESYFSDNILEY
ncbi:MAG: AIR synthase-related protein [Patescibacteria group bacterium]|nr:AIR synthase-related protein [Patescibacteria group bacterium]